MEDSMEYSNSMEDSMEYSNSMEDTLSLEDASINMRVSEPEIMPYPESGEDFSSSDSDSSDSSDSDSSSSSDSGSMEDYSLELADPTATFDAFDVLLVKCNTEYVSD